MYVEEVFDDMSETKGESGRCDSGARLSRFMTRVQEKGYLEDSSGRGLKLRSSRQVLKRFLEINLLLLDLKKVRVAYCRSFSLEPDGESM